MALAGLSGPEGHGGTMNIPLAVAAVDKDAPLRLAVAAEVAFPFGGMTADVYKRQLSNWSSPRLASGAIFNSR